MQASEIAQLRSGQSVGQSIVNNHAQAAAAYAEAAKTGTLHASHHIESKSIGSAMGLGALEMMVGFGFLGLLVGYDRAPGSLYSYGISCYVWPVIGLAALGAVLGAALGFVFGSISHGSDPVGS